MNNLDELKEIHWSDRPQGNKYGQAIHPAMLLPEGYKVLSHILLEGKGRTRASDSDKVWVNIVYDESYVIQKLVKQVLNPLNPKDYNTFQQIASKAWKVFKSTN